MSARGQKGDVNYQPSRTEAAYAEDTAQKQSVAKLSGVTQQRKIKKTDDFKQAGDLYLSFSEPERANLISNLAGDLSQVKDKQIQIKMVSNFYRANADYGTRLAKALGISMDEVLQMAKAD